MPGYFDVHSHYMPKVDDGSSSADMTMKMLRMARDEGIRSIILTPHYREPYFTTVREQIDKGFEEVKALAQRVDPKLRIYLGNEIHYNRNILEWLQSGKVHTMADTSYALIEFSLGDEYDLLHACLRTLIAAGYRPIIAHVERCSALFGKPDRIEELINLGAYIQVNAGTFTGECGFQAKRFVHKLVKQDLIDFVGSDAHNITDRRPHMKKCAEYLEKVHGSKYMKRILYDNPKRMVRDEEL